MKMCMCAVQERTRGGTTSVTGSRLSRYRREAIVLVCVGLFFTALPAKLASRSGRPFPSPIPLVLVSAESPLALNTTEPCLGLFGALLPRFPRGFSFT
jgi:hypothetical protein